MARTIEQIQQTMLQQITATPELAALNSTSQTAIYRLMIYIVAVAIMALENMFDFFKKDVEQIIYDTKPHTLQWYAGKSRAFQYGYNLPADTDIYNNAGLTDAQINSSKIITYAAVVEQERGLRVKVAKTIGANLAPLSVAEIDSFKAYMARIKDAGVKLNITSTVADNLRLNIKVRYNALVLDNGGSRIDGTDAAPVKTAIKTHLKNLPFNGVFSVQKLVDAIQLVDGVADLVVIECSTKYGLLPYAPVNITVVPDSGYLIAADADVTLNYEAA